MAASAASRAPPSTPHKSPLSQVYLSTNNKQAADMNAIEIWMKKIYLYRVVNCIILLNKGSLDMGSVTLNREIKTA